MLSFRALSMRFPDGTVALDAVDLEVPRGQFCVVLGPSGAGKSTLLRAVNAMITPTGGQVVFDGTPVGPATAARVRPRVGMVHQQFELVPRLSVLDNVLTGALPRVSLLASLAGRFPESFKRRACALLASVGLGEEHLYRRAMELSGGQQQRVAIARAFILEPDVVLADEPVASLDPKVSREILTLLRDASGRHEATVLCSLHQVELARDFADRILGVRQGRVVFDGTPDDLDDRALEAIYGPRPQEAPVEHP